MSLRARILKNISVRWLGYFLSAVISIFLFPFVIHKLGDSIYGVWVLVSSLTGYLGLLDLGIGISVVKYVSEFLGKKDTRKIREIVSGAFLLYSFIGGIALIVVAILSIIGPRVFTINPPLTPGIFQLLILIVGFNVAIGFPLGVFGGILKGYQRYDLDTYINMGILLLRSTLIVVFLSRGYGIVSLAIITLTTNLAGYLSRFIFALNLLGKGWFQLEKGKKTIRKILQYSSFVFLAGIAGRMIYETDSIIIGIFLSTSAITYYAVGWKLIAYLRELASLASNVLVPVASDFESKRLVQENRKLLIEGTKYLFLMSLFFGIIFVFMGRDIITLWIGEKYSPVAYPILLVLALSELFALPQYVSSSILYGWGKHRFFSFLCIGEAIANLLLSLILVKPYGLIGVAMGTVIPHVISTTLILPFYVCRELKLSLGFYFGKAFLPPLWGVLPFIVYVILITRTVEITNIGKLAFMVISSFIIFVMGIYILGRKSNINLFPQGRWSI